MQHLVREIFLNVTPESESMQEEMRSSDEQTQNTNATKKLQRNTHTNRQKTKQKTRPRCSGELQEVRSQKQHFTKERSAFCGNIRNMKKNIEYHTTHIKSICVNKFGCKRYCEQTCLLYTLNLL